ncbi:MAG: right-handed parallel beta-helix repeat-containing protein, partial [Candidatus Methanoperedens sp.]|nr:right-handed parallel beta-helix repeat-containing protein [Candidatus Methanoperedens sp.]
MSIKNISKRKVIVFLLISIFLSGLVMLPPTDIVKAEGVIKYVAVSGSGYTADYYCDGTDDQAEINQAIIDVSAVSSQGNPGTVHLYPGTYYTLTEVYLKNYVILEGDSKTNTFVKNVSQLRGGTQFRNDIQISSASYATVRNLAVRGVWGDPLYDQSWWDRSWRGIGISNNCSNITIDNVDIRDTLGDGITGNGCPYLTISNVNIVHVGHSGIYFRGGDGPMTITNIYIEYNANSGLRFCYANNITVKNVEVVDAWDWAVEIFSDSASDNTYNISFENLTAKLRNHDSAANGIAILYNFPITNGVFKYHDISFKNCIIDNLKGVNRGDYTPGYDNIPGAGIYVRNATDVTFDNVVVYDAKNDGIDFDNDLANGAPSTHTVKNCIISNSGGYGISKLNYSNITVNISYNDLWQNALGSFGGGATAGTGNINADPLFYSPSGGANGNNDFHLKSQYGRWNGTSWETDASTSPC